MRYFFFSAVYSDYFETLFRNFGTTKPNFPTIKELKEVVRSFHERATDIVILSVCEMEEDELKSLFSE